MGNNCVGSKTSDYTLFSCFFRSSLVWPYHHQTVVTEISDPTSLETEDTNAPENVQEKPPRVVEINKEINMPSEPANKKIPRKVKRVAIGLQEESILKRKSGHFKEYYNLGEELGKGQYGTTFLCTEKATGKKYACKSIPKVKLLIDEDVEDVRREIEIMHHLEGCPNVISIKGAFEDGVAVYVVMELCEGGELFDRIVDKGHYTERKAAKLARTIVSIVEGCHSLGVMHRDLKPENFLFVDGNEESTLKAIDFGMSVFFKPGLDEMFVSFLCPSLLDNQIII